MTLHRNYSKGVELVMTQPALVDSGPMEVD
jgi:hypothetical protein